MSESRILEIDGTKPTLEDLVEKYPCLWDPNDLNRDDRNVKRRCKKELLEKFNSYSPVQITMQEMEKELYVLRVRRFRQLKKKPSESKPSTCTPQPSPLLKLIAAGGSKSKTSSQLKQRKSARQRRQPTPTSESEVEIETDGSNSRTPPSESNLQISASQPTPISTETAGVKSSKLTLESIVLEFPCLWDPNDLNWNDIKMKERCREKVLEKYNSCSPVPITMDQLKKKLQPMRVRVKKHRRRKLSRSNQPTSASQPSLLSRLVSETTTKRRHALEDMVAEYPCLWDPNDPNRNKPKMRARCQEKVLEKFNRYSSVQITMRELRKKLYAMNTRLRRRLKPMPQKPRQLKPLTRAALEDDGAKKPTLEEMVAEYPCLWDPGDLNRSDPVVKEKCREQLLEKFNKYSSLQIDMEELKRKLANLNHRLNTLNRQREMVQQARILAGEDTTEPARILPWNMPEEPATSSNACLFNNECQDTTNQVVCGTVISFDWCRVCGEVKKDCVDATYDDKPYITRNKTILAVNDLNVELDFADFKLPTNICEDCDKKLEDLCKFVQLVRSAQDNFNYLINKSETRKRTRLDITENTGHKKKCKVTIDLNAIAGPSLDQMNKQDEVPGTEQCANEIKMKMMQNAEQYDSASDDNELVIKLDQNSDTDNEFDHKMAEQISNKCVTDSTSCVTSYDENDIDIKTKIEIGPITMNNKASDNVPGKINKGSISDNTSYRSLESFNDAGRSKASVGATSNNVTFNRDSESENQVITLDNGIKIMFGSNINNAQSSIKDICKEAAIVDIKKEIINVDPELTDKEQDSIKGIFSKDGITIKKEITGIGDGKISNEGVSSNSMFKESEVMNIKHEIIHIDDNSD